MDENTRMLQPTQTLLAEPDEIDFFKSIYDLIQHARRGMERAINTTMTVTYYEIGHRIVEKEQQGQKRAQYGKRILQGLSDYLTENIGKGYSVENLKLMRRFYIVYSETAIGQSQITQFNPNISWTHYLQLMLSLTS